MVYDTIPVSYIETKKVDTIDTYFGVDVADPYRWLEDDNSAETVEWVKKQAETTSNYLTQIPFRDQVIDRISNLYNYEKYGIPFKEGGKYYIYKNDGLQNHYVLYVQDTKDSEPEVFLDPNTFSEDGTSSLAGLSFSEDSKTLAYQLSEAGADWRKVIIMDVDSKEILDTIHDIKFSPISWYKNDGFYYSRYDKPKGGDVLTSMTQQHKVYYHKLGTPQSSDKLVFGGDIQRRYVQAQVTEDNEYLIISAAQGTSGNELYIQKLGKKNAPIVRVVDHFESDVYLSHSEGDDLYLLTNLGAPKNRIVKMDANNHHPDNWVDIIPESENVLQTVSVAGKQMFVSYLKDASTKVYQYNYDGELGRQVEFPTIGTVYGFGGKDETTETFYAFTSFNYPTTIFSYNIENGTSEVFKEPTLDFIASDYEVNQVFFESKDGTKVPMFIVHKKGLKKNGSHPTLLYGYGGFNVSLTPSFSLRWMSWLDMGGVFALANIRGGGEYGEEWHKAGTKLQKQNVFDDFIAAAEYLHSEKYTSPKKLAIFGGSNGGLLVGAVMTQRPDLMQVAVPAVGVLDMLRYHKFTAGAGWISDYGCADSSKVMFEYLQAYSPVHNVEEGVRYPSTLITTADHDDRVVPAHSFKFAAELQEKHHGENPVLIRIETKAGHGAGKPTSKVIEEIADTYIFAFYNMNAKPEYVD